jgi:glucose/arabinose dehydrogenase
MMRRLRFAFLCALLVACGDGATEPAGGTLDIAIEGLPAAAQASITVAGPGGFTRTLTASTTLSALTPGTYTLTTANVILDGATYRPTQATQTVVVTASARATATVSYTVPPDQVSITLERVVNGFDNPLYVTAPPGDSRLFVVEQTGRVRIIANGAVLQTPFLDLRSRISSGGERGLLSIAFHPSYATNGFFFVNFTDSNGDTRVERFHVSANANVADAASSTLIIGVAQPYANHNGGLVMFGVDGMLYIGMGDGGSGGDPLGHGQNRNSLLGKMLRIDVSGTLPYTIPPSNPFVGQAGMRGEIWALGLRNPWRFSFDRQAGQLYIGDVGQGVYEEVNVVAATQAGLNYGWNTMEGTHCYNAGTCNRTGLTLPLVEYSHSDGCSVTGGYVYRGSRLPELVGRYFYSDYCSGWLRSVRIVGGVATSPRDWGITSVGNITSFGEDAGGELYVTSANGSVYRIARR